MNRTIRRLLKQCGRVVASVAVLFNASLATAQTRAMTFDPVSAALPGDSVRMHVVPELDAQMAFVGNRVAVPFVPSLTDPRLISSRFPSPATTAIRANPGKKPPAQWYAPLASLVVPGSGQALLKQQRTVAYLAAEAFLVFRTARSNREKNASKAWYQKLAADVAREGFGADKPVGPWDYYEILEHSPASGAYDMSPGGIFTPESDTLTYNGRVWYVARQIFWDSPEQTPAISSQEYQRALARYQKSALQGSFRFSWKDQTNIQGEYKKTIADANGSAQQVVSAVGFLAATHLASMVDAYVTVRLRRFGGAGLMGASLKTELRPVGGYGDNLYGASMVLSVPIGNGGRDR